MGLPGESVGVQSGTGLRIVTTGTQILLGKERLNPKLEKTNPLIYQFAKLVIKAAQFFFQLLFFPFTSGKKITNKVTLISHPKTAEQVKAEENFDDLRKLMKNKFGLILDSIYETQLAPTLSGAKEQLLSVSEKMTPILESLSKLNGKETILDPNLFGEDLGWIFEGFDPKDKEALIAAVCDKVKDVPHNSKISAKEIATSILNFVINGDFAECPSYYVDYSELIYTHRGYNELVYAHTIDLLFKNKIERVQKALSEIVQSQSETLTKQFLKKIGDAASERLGENIVKTLQAMEPNFSQAIDGIVEDVNDYVKAAAEAQEVTRKLTASELAESELAAEAQFAKGLENQTRPSKVVAKQLIELELEKQAEIQQLEPQKTDESPKDYQARQAEVAKKFQPQQEEIEKEYYSHLGKEITQALLPSKEVTVDGQVKTVSGLEALYDEVATLPEELRSLQADLRKIYKLGMPEALQSPLDLEMAFTHAESAIKKFVLSMEPTIVDGVASGLKVTEKMFSDLDSQNEVLLDSILPSVEEQAWEGIAKELLNSNAEKFASKFHFFMQIDRRDDAERKQWLDARYDLANDLIKLVKSQTPNYDWSAMTLAKDSEGKLLNREDRLFWIIDTFIHDIEEKIREVNEEESLKANELKRDHITERQVFDLLKEYFAPKAATTPEPDAKTVELYADLVDNIAFKVGKFGSFSRWVAGFKSVRQAIGRATVGSIGEYRTSIRPTLKSSIASMDRTLSKEKIDSLIASQTLEKLEATKQELEEKKQEIVGRAIIDYNAELHEAKKAELKAENDKPEKDNRRIRALEREERAFEKQAKQIALTQQELTSVDEEIKSVDEKIAALKANKTRSDYKIAIRRQQRERRLEDIGNIYYDKVMFGLRNSGFTRFVAKRVVGSTPDHLNKVVTRVFDTTLGRPKLVQGLFLQIFEKTAGAIHATTVSSVTRNVQPVC
jgi:hypothetical protein